MALQPFIGPWPPFQVLDPIHSRWDSLDGGSASREVSIYTQNKRTQHRHNGFSGIGTHDPSFRAIEDISCLRPRGHCDRQILPLPNINLNLQYPFR
jgi:hypothetical protein